jgi:major membrane immunogen (membrane-anchored lipoprotein)
MLPFLAMSTAFLFTQPPAALNPALHAGCSQIDRSDASSISCQLSGRMQLFDELFTKGGMAVQDGDMPTALYYFKQALIVDPANEQTKKMVAKFEMLGIQPQEPGAVDVASTATGSEID